jgi:hypothetical protein
MMTTNLFVIANVKQLLTGGSFRILLFFFPPNILGLGILNSAIFNTFHNWVEFGTILEDLWNLVRRGFETPPRYATEWTLLMMTASSGGSPLQILKRHSKSLNHQLI